MGDLNHSSHGADNPHAMNRVVFIDEVRGFTIISMVLFHAAYDFAYLMQYEMPWFTSGLFQDLWRWSISWVFLFLAGWMCGFSKNNAKRGFRYAIAAVAIYVATCLAAIDAPINFGILFCMAGSTLIASIFQKFPLKTTSSMLWGVSCIFLFALTFDVPNHTYQVSGLEWLGFPSPGFYSGDYYPLIPYSFLYFAGFSFQRAHKTSGKAYPLWMYAAHIPVLSWIGRHSLSIYLLHQPVILGFVYIASSLFKL